MKSNNTIKNKGKIINMGSLLILGSSILWGTALLYSQYILDNGIDSKDLVSLKMLFGFVTMFIYILYKDRSLLKIDRRGLGYAAVIGLVCHALYNLFMFEAIERTTISTTVTLLYTSPIFVAIISRILFKEKITTKKMFALIFAVIGSWLTVTSGSFKSLSFNTVGVFYGLGAGLFYGTMTIINKFIVNDYKGTTLLTYTLGFAFIFSLAFSNPLAILHIEFNPLVYIFVIMLGVFSTAISYLIYLKGLSLGVESSKAAIIATFEVPVSIVGSVLIFGQKLSLVEAIGVLLVVTSIIIINEKKARDDVLEDEKQEDIENKEQLEMKQNNI
ncbi:MAG: DMT family transporter [Tissierella sp.]|uniref:DMT family transporter n=1 Tax=Tissierella sp. TaxID=41274 RepID=UPI003F9B157A